MKTKMKKGWLCLDVWSLKSSLEREREREFFPELERLNYNLKHYKK